MQISIHAPQWGATAAAFAVVAVSSKFQSTHPSGVRRPWTQPSPQFSDFNPRTPVGCDDPSRRSRRDQGYFNPRTPVGCDAREVAGAVHELISIHAPQWGATIFAHILPTLFRISVHAPQWGATCGRFSTRFTVVFQSTHPSGVRLTPPESRSHSAIFQSTHPSGVRPGVGRGGRVSGMISIHAPQWGATRSASLPWQPIYFNPRTPVGCDVARTDVGFNANEFQSTHPSGVRRADGQGRGRPLQISIHAPQWGATTITSIGKSGAGDFNPRTPVGCDLHQLDVQLNIIKFQSTHPSGVRRVYYLQSHVTRHISIHAPQWGATWCSACLRRPAVYFNPRTPVGCDHPVSAGQVHSAISIHAPQWGATRTPHIRLLHLPISIHAPQWGATVQWALTYSTCWIFQSTHPSGVRPP